MATVAGISQIFVVPLELFIKVTDAFFHLFIHSFLIICPAADWVGCRDNIG